MSYDYNDLSKNPLPKSVQDAKQRRVSKVYKDTQANTDPNQQHPPSQLSQGEVTVTPDVIEELTKALHHLQQVVLKLRGGV